MHLDERILKNPFNVIERRTVERYFAQISWAGQVKGNDW